MSVLRPGDRIADRYRVETVIARGGMGAVYRATDLRLERDVAVKVLLRELGDDPTSIARFEREARATAKLSHPGIVSVLDFGTTPEGLSYLVMEHVVGTTLSAVLDQGRLAPARAADIVEQALGALAVAHQAGIVHRDLKPGNLMLVPVGVGGRELVKVLDFGIAQLKSGAAYTRLTQTGVVVGTPSFMSPEQSRGEPCDARTDLYAMGMVLWCCLTGTRPFRKKDVAALVDAVQNEVPPRADQIVPEVPSALATIAAKALEKRPDARFATASELASALVAARSQSPRPVSVSSGLPAPSPEAPEATAATAVVQRPIDRAPASPTQASPHPKIALPPPARVQARAAPAHDQPRSLGPRVVGCVLLSGGAAVLIVVAVIVVGLVLLDQAELGPMFPSLSGPSAPPFAPEPRPRMPTPSGPASSSGSDDPSFGEPLCARAIECCHAYTSRVEAMMPTCEQVVGFSQGDLTSCQRQLDMWRDMAREHGASLDECE